MKTLPWLLVAAVLIIGGYFLFSSREVSVPGPNATTTPDARVRGPENVTLRVGDIKDAAGLLITLNSVSQDSRCPVDVQCIQAGWVVANATYEIGTEKVTLDLRSDAVPLEIAGYRITITEVQPVPRSETTIKPEDYVVTFRAEPLASGEAI